MGSGVWSASFYTARVSQRKGADAFTFSAQTNAIHPTLSPKGLEVRESRDSAEHPDSNAILIGLDVSGSMGAVVRAIHKDLPQLFKLLVGHVYIPHPQIMFSAFSNGTCAPVPIQVGQFESDNRMDQHLENMIIGGTLAGGCDAEESSELLIYAAARHTSTDAWEKRQRKGYLFIITDEPAYNKVKKDEVAAIFGRKINADIPIEVMIKEAREHYHVYCVHVCEPDPTWTSESLKWWTAQLGPGSIIRLENADDVSESIALVIGLTERMITLKEGLQHIKDDGGSKKTADTLARTLALIADQAVKGTGYGLSDLDTDAGTKKAKRL